MKKAGQINYPTISQNGRVVSVIVPIEDYLALREDSPMTYIPEAVADAIILNQIKPLKAWREYKNFSQEEIAQRMGITRSAYAHTEASARPRKPTLESAAQALGIDDKQLIELY
ncbi:MAG: helix-turn-helix domain-containing protein [Desulfarculales bacterium]|jgi:predicted transcriptional regulator|nr:helix-turn-helix domain-containing protein [Desulfarculales bacterium]